MARSKPKVKARAKKQDVRRSPAPKRAKASARSKPRSRQKFVVHRYTEDGFKIDGLRPYAKYRDLGILGATNGMAIAHVIRFVPPCDPKVVSKLHFHDVDLQMVYVLKGSITTELEGQGALKLKAGDAWLQPPKIKHKVLDYSDDCEVLEIVLPGSFKTVEIES